MLYIYTQDIQHKIIERSKIIFKDMPILKKNILKSVSLYIRAMSTFVSELVLCFFLLRNDVTERTLKIFLSGFSKSSRMSIL